MREMKSPPIYSADEYEPISKVEITRLKAVVEAAQEWAHLQSVNAITTEDAAVRLVEAVGIYEEDSQ